MTKGVAHRAPPKRMRWAAAVCFLFNRSRSPCGCNGYLAVSSFNIAAWFFTSSGLPCAVLAVMQLSLVSSQRCSLPTLNEIQKVLRISDNLPGRMSTSTLSDYVFTCLAVEAQLYSSLSVAVISHLVQEDILVLSLHHASSVLPHHGDYRQQVHSALLLKLSHSNKCSNEHSSAADTRTAGTNNNYISNLLMTQTCNGRQPVSAAQPMSLVGWSSSWLLKWSWRS